MCNRTATWCYLPSGGGRYMYCDEHVPRGCSCNNYDIQFDGEPDESKGAVAWWPIDDIDFNVINTERHNDSYHYQYLDNKGRVEPCCEYDYDPDGIEVFENITIAPITEVKKALNMVLQRNEWVVKDQKTAYRTFVLDILNSCERRGDYINYNQFMSSVVEHVSNYDRFLSNRDRIVYSAATHRLKEILVPHRTVKWVEEWREKKLQTSIENGNN